MDAPFKKITLDNGLRIILAPQEQSLATTVLVLVEAGSKYEVKKINGISHFLEHMCFEGTEKRPRSIDIANELENIGAAKNAFTSLEYTGYYAKAEPRHLNVIMDVVSDIYLNSVFDPKEIDKERGVIAEEINMYEDLPMRQVQNEFMELLYGDQPAGWDIAGKKEVIRNLTREDFLRYRNEHYLAESTIVVVAGNFNEKEILKQIENGFGKIGKAGKKGKIKTTEHQEKPGVLIKAKETDQTHLILGVRAFDIFDERKYAIDVLAGVLGGGAGSRLFQKIRGEMGAAYYIYADSDLLSDHGYLAVAAGIDHRKIDEVIQAIIGEFNDLKKKEVNPNELQRAKEYIVGGLMLGLETSDALAGFYGGQEVITRKIITPQEMADKIRAVKPEELMAVARDIMEDNKLNLAIIGPFREKERFEKNLSLD